MNRKTNKELAKLRGKGVKRIDALVHNTGYTPKPGNKPEMSLLPYNVRVMIVKALESGVEKYGYFNWRVKPNSYRTLTDAAERHIGQFLEGQDFDDESGQHHIAHAIAALVVLLEEKDYEPALVDNRAIPNNKNRGK